MAKLHHQGKGYGYVLQRKRIPQESQRMQVMCEAIVRSGCVSTCKASKGLFVFPYFRTMGCTAAVPALVSPANPWQPVDLIVYVIVGTFSIIIVSVQLLLQYNTFRKSRYVARSPRKSLNVNRREPTSAGEAPNTDAGVSTAPRPTCSEI